MAKWGCPHHTVLPRRDKDGYGFSEGLLKKALKHKPDLIIVLDSGTQAHEAIDKAREHCDIHVIDHHDPGKTQEHQYVFNPEYMVDNAMGRDLKRLCTAGLAYLIFEKHLLDCSEMALTLAAVGTVADVVPLLGLNRAIVHNGLTYLNRKIHTPLLLAAIAKEKNIKHWDTQTIGFQIGPLINAAGRLNQPDTAFAGLMVTNTREAEKSTNTLSNLNQQRKEIEAEITEEAIALSESEKNAQIIIVQKKGWHPGVIGIVAARLSDKFNRPAIVMAWEPEQQIWTGSGRSPKNDQFNLGDFLIGLQKESVILKGGGHAQAAGLSVTPKQMLKARNRIRNQTFDPSLNIGEIEIIGETWDMTLPEWTTLWEKLGPFGTECPKPHLKLPPCECEKPQELRTNKSPFKIWAYKSTIKKGNQYITLLTNASNDTLLQEISKTGALAQPEKNLWNDRVYYQLRLKPIPNL